MRTEPPDQSLGAKPDRASSGFGLAALAPAITFWAEQKNQPSGSARHHVQLNTTISCKLCRRSGCCRQRGVRAGAASSKAVRAKTEISQQFPTRVGFGLSPSV